MRRFTGLGVRGLLAACVVAAASIPATAGLITVQAYPAGTGTVSGGGFYADGTSCTVVAAPAGGYEFVSWADLSPPGLASSDASYTFVVNGNRTLIAGFTQAGTFVVAAIAEPTEGGTTDGSDVYPPGASCTLTAIPNEGYVFVDWTENGAFLSSSTSYTLTVTETRTLYANFALDLSYAIATSSDPVAGGSTSGAGSYAVDDNCTVVASPATGYAFVEWTESASTVSTSTSYAFSVTGDRTLVAHFALRQYAITTSANPGAGGTTGGDGPYVHGDSCTATASPAAGYGFSSWTEGAATVSSNASYTFTATADRDLVANFLRQWTIDAQAGSNGSISPSGAVMILEGSDETFTFSSDTGYAIQEVAVDGSVVALCVAWTFEDVVADHTLDVIFANDSDGDGLTDALEIVYGTIDGDIDSDDDGSTDGAEVMAGTDPLDPTDAPPSPTDDGGGSSGCSPGASGGAAAMFLAATLGVWVRGRRGR